jgi:hypothetical protein
MNVLRAAMGCFLVAVAVAGVNVGTLVQKAPATAARRRNPLEGDEQARRAGAKLYAAKACCGGKVYY